MKAKTVVKMQRRQKIISCKTCQCLVLAWLSVWEILRGLETFSRGRRERERGREKDLRG